MMRLEKKGKAKPRVRKTKVKGKDTDLLIGITSIIPRRKSHFFLADFDSQDEEAVMQKVGRVLFDKEKFGVVYMVKTGRGFHLLNFTHRLSLNKYVLLLKKMGADKKFIKWVKKVGYGVLRLSRRGYYKDGYITGTNVPRLYRVLIPSYKYKKRENKFYRSFYFSILRFEQDISDIKRVRVYGAQNF